VPDPVAATNDPRRLDTFLISYGNASPSRAQQITNRIANVFVDETSKTRTEHAEDTSAFIAAQQHESKARLDALEDQLRHAKEAHMGQLPEQTPANLQTLSGLRQQLESNNIALRGEQDRLSMIDREIESVTQGNDVVLIGRDNPSMAPPETRVMMLERQLAEAQMMFKDAHPEVQSLREQLKAARADAAADKAKPAADRLAQLRLDPAYRQLQQEQTTAKMRVNELQRQSSDLTRQISAYQARVESAPMVEQQMAALNRDYELEKRQYEDVSAKLHTATIAENVERNRDGEQFAVLESASYPTSPTSPIAWRVMLIALAIGLCLGAAATLGREYLDRSVHDVHDLRTEFELPVLGEVAHIQTV
jgi:polysaccharide chain length determinant protein (PEP-CTERM system associated)